MGDDLKVVVSSVLEADVDESVARISAQLPAISERLSKSDIKIQVGIDQNVLQAEAQKISKTLDKSLATHEVGVKLRVTSDAKSMLQGALKGMSVDDGLTAAMTKNLNNMRVQVDNIAASWQKAGRAKERLLQLSIAGTDQDRRNVQIVQTYDESGKKVSETVKKVSLDLKQLQAEEEAAAKKQKSANESRVVALQKQLDMLKKLKANYSGNGRGDAVTGESNLATLESKYSSIKSEIQSLQNVSGAYSKTRKAEIDSEIAELERLITEYQKAEKSSTDFRNKDVTTVKGEYGFKLTEFENQLKTAGILTDDFKAKIEGLRTELSSVGDSQGLHQFLDNFSRLKAETGAFESAEKFRQTIASIEAEMATMPSSVNALEGKMRQISAPTETLKENMAEVRQLMSAWNNDPSDEKKVEIYNQLKEKLSLCNKELTQLNQVQNASIKDTKLFAGLDKAKADLATIERTWSAFKSNPGLNAQFQQLSASLQRVKTQADLTKWTAQFNAFKSEVKAAGANMQSLGDILRNNVGKVLQWVSATTLLFRAFHLLKNAVNTVVELDTAMVDLKKVTTGTTADYQAFYQSANTTAKALNATTEEVISQTAEWARLGFSMQDAAKLAQNAMTFAAVSPGMDQSMATDGLVSVIKAYGIEVEDTMDGIISKINDVGKHYCPAA